MKKNSKRIMIVLCLCLIMSTLVACGGPAETTDSDAETNGVKVLQFAHSDPANDTSPYHTYALLFSDYLNDISNGAWKVEITGGGQLGTEVEEVVSLSSGLLDASLISNIVLANTSVDQSALILPFMFNSLDEVNYVVEDKEIMDILNEALLETANIVGLDYIHLGLRKLFMSGKFDTNTTLVDLKNKKIRVPETPLPVDTFKAISQVPTTISGSEVITALQQGTVDGVDFPILPGMAAGIGEISKTLIKTNHYYVGALTVFSTEFWNSLSDQEKAWFEEASAKAAADQRAKVESMEEEMYTVMQSQGCTPINIDTTDFIAATRDVYDKYAAMMNPILIQKIEERLQEYRR